DSLQRQTALAADPPAAGPPATQRGHVGLDPGFINELQPCADRGWTASAASAAAGGRCQRVPARERTVFFLNRSPSRRRNRHTVSCETFTPRAANSSFSWWSVSCGVWLIRSTMNPRCGSSTNLRYLPILAGATEPLAR